MAKRLDYFPHPFNLRTDKRIKILRRGSGLEGVAVFYWLLEEMGAADGLKIPFSEIDKELLADSFNIDEGQLSEIVKNSVEAGIITLEDGFLSSALLDERLKPLLDLRRKQTEGGRKRWEAVKETSSTPKGDLEVTSSTPNGDLKETTKKTDDFDISRFIEFFNKSVDEAGSTIPKIQGMSEKRKLALLARVKEHGKKALQKAVANAVKSDFLNGRTDKPFKASIDWILKPNNFPKVLEGNYENVKPSGGKVHDHRRGVEITATCAEDYLNSSF